MDSKKKKKRKEILDITRVNEQSHLSMMNILCRDEELVSPQQDSGGLTRGMLASSQQDSYTQTNDHRWRRSQSRRQARQGLLGDET
jgi:hypothetical protein